MKRSPKVARRFPSVLRRALLGVESVGEAVQVSVERSQEALDGEPLDAAPSSLDAGDVGRIHLQTARKLLLGDSCLVAQRPQRSAEHGQFGVSRGLIHDAPLLGIPGQGVIGCAANIQVGARDGCNHPGAVAPRAHTPGAPVKLPAWRLGFLAKSSPFGASDHKEEP